MKEIIDFISEMRNEDITIRNYDFIKSRKYIQHFPLAHRLHENFINSFKNTKNIFEVEAFLEYNNKNQKILEYIQKRSNMIFNSNCRLYELYASPYKIITDYRIISQLDKQPDNETQNILYLKRIGEYNKKYYFILENYKPTIIKIPEIKFPKLSYNAMTKSIAEISSFSNFGNDIHKINSIIAPYIGSDILKNKVDGIGSSYQGSNRVAIELKRIDDVLSNFDSDINISIQYFGIRNFINKNINSIEKLRDSGIGKFKTISFNNQAVILSEFKDSEFKYAMGKDSINVYDLKSLQNNIDFKHSLIFNNYMIRTLSKDLFIKAYKKVLKEIEKEEKKHSKEVIEMYGGFKNLELQIKRMCSYFLSFKKNAEDITKLVERSTNRNISDVIDVIHKDSSTATKQKREEKFKDIWTPMIRLAFLSSDSTEDDIIEKLVNIVGLKPNIAKNMLKELYEKGIISQNPITKEYYIV